MVTKFDVVIGGGGATGLTLALMLARISGGALKIGLVDMSRKSPKVSPRTSAVALGPKTMLESIGAWPTEESFAAPVRRIDVFDALTSHEALAPDITFKSADHEAVMAWIVRHSDLEAHLQKIAEASDINFIEGEIVSYQSEGCFAEIKLEGGARLQARLVVAADGARSRLRELVKAPCVEWGYGRSAIVANLAHHEPHSDRAIQIFYPEGPFATLPLVGDRSSLVWTVTNERANQLRRASADELTSEIQQASADHLGLVTLEGGVASFALGYKHVRSFYDERLAFVGDAARRVHPLAGQGLNLGFRDVAALTECVIETARLGLDFGLKSTLAEYGRRRNLDSVVSSSGFDLLHTIFSLEADALRIARKSGLSLVQNSDRIKELLIREATGLSGHYPQSFVLANVSQ